MLINRRTIRIEWGDCDPAGIVFYPQYFKWFDAAAAALDAAAGFPRADLVERQGIVIPMVETRCSITSALARCSACTCSDAASWLGASGCDVAAARTINPAAKRSALSPMAGAGPEKRIAKPLRRTTAATRGGLYPDLQSLRRIAY